MPATPAQRRFATTRWSVVLQARQKDSPESERALEELCEDYWFPVYAFVRRQTGQPDGAKDLTQAFFLHLLSHSFLKNVSEQNGRFRSFLLASVRNFLNNETERNNAIKRGGHMQFHRLDWEAVEQRFLQLGHTESADVLFEKQWTLSLLSQVLQKLKQELSQKNQSQIFDVLSACLTTSRDAFEFEAAAQQLGVTVENARQLAHRLRKRYRELLRAEIRETVTTDDQVEEEVQRLFRSLAGTPQ